ncbi:MAG: family 20 glycosylhydrolase [Cytophagales bacterium]|nr:family 20 glycosylhydrolase [Cytophagales bacterium]
MRTNWNPATQVEGISKEQIMGVETPLWSETIENMNDIEYLLFPRLPGIAEIAWSPAEGRSWDEYKVRLGNHGPRMKALGIDFYPSAKVPWVDRFLLTVTFRKVMPVIIGIFHFSGKLPCLRQTEKQPYT